jgi:flagellar hook assembly protein FlgD
VKKYIVGFIIGVGVSASTAVIASNSVQTVLFPTLIKFHVNGKLTEVDGGNSVLNYNNQAYIPLRMFSENIGATVDYRSSSSIDPQKHQIDIYHEDDQNFKTHDPEGYLSIGNTTLDVGTSEITANGILRVNKGLDASRKIELIIKTKDNQYTTSYFHISNPQNMPLQPGDIREFTAYLTPSTPQINPSQSIESVTIMSDEVAWVEGTIEGRPGGIGVRTPFNVNFGIDYSPLLISDGSASISKMGDSIPFRFSIGTTEDSPMLLRKTLDFQLEIINADTKQVVWSHRTPSLPTMTFPSWEKNEVLRFAWDQRDNDGKSVPPGNYLLRVIGSTSIHYSDTEASEIKTQVIDENRINRAVEGSGIQLVIEPN